jgi:transposase InsO family protein
VLASHSRARRHPPPPVRRPVVERILALRDHPPAGLQRVPGPRTIRTFLAQDEGVQAAGERPPRSTATIWRVPDEHGRIGRPPARAREPLDRPPPLTHWQLACKDVATVPADPDGQRQHVVEALNCVDCGTSILVGAEVRGAFTEETTLETVVALVREHGLPEAITLDRDPRFVGSASGRDCPSPLLRLLTCLGLAVEVCPPRRPDLNGYVERYNGTYGRECLRVHCPATLERAREVTAAFQRHDNHERPNQALSCGDRPPRVAFPDLPARPPLPAQVDPDRWLARLDGRPYVRVVRGNGVVLVEHQPYYVGRALAGQRVALAVAAAERVLVVRHRGEVLKRLPPKGLQGRTLPLAE